MNKKRQNPIAGFTPTPILKKLSMLSAKLNFLSLFSYQTRGPVGIGVSLRSKRGFTLTEVLIVLAITTILVSMTISSFKTVGGNEALETSVVSTISILNEARSMAISSKNASNYGVRIFDNKLVSFKNTYGTENKEFILPNLVSMSTSTGIGNDIVFLNVSGKTSASGTITVFNLSDQSKSVSIRIYETGIIERLD